MTHLHTVLNHHPNLGEFTTPVLVAQLEKAMESLTALRSILDPVLRPSQLNELDDIGFDLSEALSSFREDHTAPSS